jgi:hypothetical protein
MSAIWLALILAFGAMPASATTFKLEFAGTASGAAVQGAFFLDVQPVVHSNGVEERNQYALNATDYTFTLNGTAYSGHSADFADAVSLIKSTNSANFFNAPFAALTIDLFGVGAPSLVIASVNPNPAIPLATLETMPATLAGWMAVYGAIFQPAMLLEAGGSSHTVSLTSYTLTTVAETPIPGALLMFGTGLVGLGTAGVRRYRRGTGTSLAKAAA